LQSKGRKKTKRTENFLEDFDIEKNKKGLSAKQLASLDRWERFEKSFPFYRIDVNGFM